MSDDASSDVDGAAGGAAQDGGNVGGGRHAKGQRVNHNDSFAATAGTGAGNEAADGAVLALFWATAKKHADEADKAEAAAKDGAAAKTEAEATDEEAVPMADAPADADAAKATDEEAEAMPGPADAAKATDEEAEAEAKDAKNKKKIDDVVTDTVHVAAQVQFGVPHPAGALLPSEVEAAKAWLDGGSLSLYLAYILGLSPGDVSLEVQLADAVDRHMAEHGMTGRRPRFPVNNHLVFGESPEGTLAIFEDRTDKVLLHILPLVAVAAVGAAAASTPKYILDEQARAALETGVEGENMDLAAILAYAHGRGMAVQEMYKGGGVVILAEAAFQESPEGSLAIRMAGPPSSRLLHILPPAPVKATGASAASSARMYVLNERAHATLKTGKAAGNMGLAAIREYAKQLGFTVEQKPGVGEGAGASSSSSSRAGAGEG
jgi:hypothetical protein